MAHSTRTKRLRSSFDEEGEEEPRTSFSINMPCEWLPSNSSSQLSRTSLVQVKREDKVFQKVAKPFLDLSFDIEAIVQVQNPLLYSSYHIQKEVMQMQNQCVNETMLYHSTKRNSLYPICAGGMDVLKSRVGFFGRGLYFSDDILKANDYASKDEESGLSCILCCSVALGRVKGYDAGIFDRSLLRAPDNFDSVKGFVRQGFEYTVYSNSQVYLAYFVLYRVPPIQFARMEAPNLPGQQVVFITVALTEFFNKLRQRAGPALVAPVNLLIKALLKRETSPALFLAQMSTILKASPPAYLVDKLETELMKCRLPPPPPPAQGPPAQGPPAQ